jgi:hypothetical protein
MSRQTFTVQIVRVQRFFSKKPTHQSECQPRGTSAYSLTIEDRARIHAAVWTSTHPCLP